MAVKLGTTPPRTAGPRVTFESQCHQHGSASSGSAESQAAQGFDDGSELSQQSNGVAGCGGDACKIPDAGSMTLDISRDEGGTLPMSSGYSSYSCPPSLELCASEAQGRGGGGGDSDEDSDDSDSDDELHSTFLPTQRQDALDADNDEDEDGSDDEKAERDAAAEDQEDKAAASARSAAAPSAPSAAAAAGSAAFSEADAGSLSAQLSALQEHRKQRAADKRHYETVDADLAERIAALIAERNLTQHRWVSQDHSHTRRLDFFSQPAELLLTHTLAACLPAQEEKHQQQDEQEKQMMTALRGDRTELKRRREDELRVIEEKRRRIEENEQMQKEIAAALGLPASQCSQQG